MAIIGNNPESFLHALSDFWIRYFADIGDLKAAYEGTSILFGQAYLDLLTTVLNTSVDDAPLFRKEYYRLITVREDQVVWAQNFNAPTRSRWTFTPEGDVLKAVGSLQNKVYAPDAAMTVGVDIDTFDATGALRFIGNDPTETASLPPFFGVRRVDTAIGGGFIVSGLDWASNGVKKGDVIRAHPYATLPQGDRTLADVQSYVVVSVAGDELGLSLATPAPLVPDLFVQTYRSWWIDREGPNGTYDSGLPCTDTVSFGWTGLGTGSFVPSKNITVNEVAFWAVDAKVDDFALYQNFGHLVTQKGASTEAYRALVKGLMQLYLFGPAIDRLESALNVVGQLPVVRNDGEVVTAYDSGHAVLDVDWKGTGGSFTTGIFYGGASIFTERNVGGFFSVTQSQDARNIGIWRVAAVLSGNALQLETPGGAWDDAGGVGWEFSQTDVQTVTTSAGVYQFDRRAPVRADVAALTAPAFKAFETLTTAVSVVDYVQDPEWWHNLPVPEELLPGVDVSERLADTQLRLNHIGDVYRGRIGDPGLYVGADENGIESASGNNYRHGPAFILMDKFLKTHLFRVTIDQSVRLSGDFVASLSDTVRQAKPAYTFALLQPGTSFSETLRLLETTLQVQPSVTSPPEPLTQQAHPLLVGGAWTVGGEWRYVTTVMAGATAHVAGSGFMRLLVDGLDPFITPLPQSPTSGVYESPLYLTVV